MNRRSFFRRLGGAVIAAPAAIFAAKSTPAFRESQIEAMNSFGFATEDDFVAAANTSYITYNSSGAGLEIWVDLSKHEPKKS